MSTLRTRKGRKSFTLIEMLVVILIIIIMVGIIFRIMPLVLNKISRARANYELQQLQNALTEYFNEYGSFPPVDFVEYEYESPSNQTAWFRETFLPNNGHDYYHSTNTEFFADTDDRAGHPGWSLNYRYGLVSYLYPRRDGQRHWFNDDTERDARAKARWRHFIYDIGPDYGDPRYHATPPGLESQAPYSNRVASLTDPWGREYKYVSRSPYVRYRLWSVGPDGVDGTWDDVNMSQQQ